MDRRLQHNHSFPQRLGFIRHIGHAVRRTWQLYRRDPTVIPPVGSVDLGSLRRLQPMCPAFGYGRGQPIDRYYIERFLAHNAGDIKQRVLEIGDATYTRRFGGARVSHSDVLHVVEGNPQATIIADIAQADHIPADSFDCIIFTQTLHLIYDFHAAIRTLYRVLKPDGVLLVTAPGITPRDRSTWGVHWYWSFTAQAAQRMFDDVFSTEYVQVEAHGNVLAAVAFLEGLAVSELKQEELDYRDAAYDLLVTIRAVKQPPQ